METRITCTLLVTALLTIGMSAGAGADNHEPPVTVTSVDPVEAGAALVQRSAGPAAGQPDGWRLNLDVFLRNDGPEAVTLEQVRIAYTGGSNPSDLVVPTDPGAPAPWVIPRNPTDLDETEVIAAETLLSGDPSDPGVRRRANVPEDRVLPFPLPDQVTVEFTFAGFSEPVSVTRALTEYVPPGGATAFPFAAQDLQDGQYLASGQNHRFGSAHRRSTTQRFSEDFAVVRWNGTDWVTTSEGGSATANEDRLIWDMPVYAMADGTVLRCFNSVPDNEAVGDEYKSPDLELDEDDPDKMPGGGNSFIIQHAPGEFTLYAHLREGTLSTELCPEAESDQGLKYPPGVPGAQVKSGQFLGRIGNSGSSSGPHLHLHTQRGHDDFDGVSGNGRPLMYNNIRVLDAGAYDPDEDDDPPWRTVNGAAVTISGQTVNGTQIGGFAGYGEVGRMLMDPLPRINLELTKTDDTDPAIAGTGFDYMLEVVNHGPDEATNILLSDFLPSQVAFAADDGGCVWAPGPARVCSIPDLDAGEQAPPITMTVDVPHDLVYDNGGPLTITNVALVSAGPGLFEATPEDNEAEEITWVFAEADLEVVSFEVTDPLPAQLLIGQDATLGLRSTVTNHGPSWPMDVSVLPLPTLSPALAWEPLDPTAVAEAVELGELRQVDHAFTVTCLEPGIQHATFTVHIEPDHAADQDPDPTNNTAELSVDIECVMPIAINIRPGNEHNQIQPGSNGDVSVAALTTEAGEYDLPLAFDATLIDPATVRFGHPDLTWSGTGGASISGTPHVKDAHELDDKNKDGDLDMVLRFTVPGTGIGYGDVEACMKGTYVQGGQSFTFFGCDFVETIP